MPDGLSSRAVLLLIAVAFGLSFVLQARSGGGASAGAPARHEVAGFVAAPPGVKLAAADALPALRQPRRPARRVVRRARVTPASTVEPVAVVPTATATPAPTATAIPAPPVTPRPAVPKPTPVPTAEPPSGEFDTTGEEP